MNEVAASLYTVMDRYLYWLNMPRVRVIDVIEIIIIAFVLYNVMAWIKNTRAWSVWKGIIVILIFLVVAAVFQMETILWLASRIISIAVIALVIIFQPELRDALESLGRRNFLSWLFDFDFGRDTAMIFSEETIAELIKAAYEMGGERTGALIVVERKEHLNEYTRTGIAIDSLISSQLLLNIFEHNTPLHDGAAIVRGDRLVAATCYLPLSANRDLSKDLGTRHRAAVGISEVSDSLTIVVSEETGAVSLAAGGMLYRNLDAEALRDRLRSAARDEAESESVVKKMRRTVRRSAKRNARKGAFSGKDRGEDGS